MVDLTRPLGGLDENRLDVPSHLKGISKEDVVSLLKKLAEQIEEELKRLEPTPALDDKPVVICFGLHPLSTDYYALERIFSSRGSRTLSFHDECSIEFYDFVTKCMIAVNRTALGDKDAHDFLQESFKEAVEEDINDVKPFLLLYMSYRTVVPFKPRAFTKLENYYRDKNIKDGYKVLRKYFELTDEDTRYIVGDRYGITGRQVSEILKKDSVFDADIKKINTYIPFRAYLL